MKKTLYISDLDGTLLDSRSQISPASGEMLNRMIADGLNFSIATARTPATVVRLMSGIDCRLPLIVMTGAALWENGKLTEEQFLQPEEVDILEEITARHGVRPFFYTDHNGLIEAYHQPLLDDYEQNFVDQRSNTAFKRFVLQNGISEAKRGRAMLVFAAGDYGLMGKVHEEARKRLRCSMTHYHDVFNPSIGFFEVMAAGVSKARAVERIARQIAAERIVVFGDSLNDLSMREVADLFVAPSNAAEEVRRVADYVTGSHDEDSVAKWIAGDLAEQKQ